MNIANSTILITGGTSGIGLELVSQLTQQGATLIVTGRNLEALHATKSRFPQVHIVQSDVSNPNDIERLYQAVTQQFPALNMIINNAGLMRLIDLQDTRHDLADIIREINTNLSGTIQMVHQFLPHLLTQKAAAIVNVSSAIAFMAYSSAPIYSAAKAGVHAYTKALRLQLEDTNVNVFELIPPGVNTNLQTTWAVQPDPGQMMDVDKLVSAAIKGLLNDTWEIKPGLVNVIKFASRIAPAFIERNLGHREFKKFKQITKP
ncbi:short-chain dehydrogenase/reductase SDR [Fibrella aestuarina BUZ 2]|uniref:Short-chain dehydrogenase/reductase SDR n=1 Tax=Fibrella aestuarina BUZ 2 TaxID=1166018 RepID=I0KBB7_9BACT|nr:SDR family NAD(P)-dependent oxidoreductase [Fibrella aestuarina]CCH01420.1 short-chain dehydrogenase/reductase SDR [Fibrella aestuarina BUZ 2]